MPSFNYTASPYADIKSKYLLKKKKKKKFWAFEGIQPNFTTFLKRIKRNRIVKKCDFATSVYVIKKDEFLSWTQLDSCAYQLYKFAGKIWCRWSLGIHQIETEK